MQNYLQVDEENIDEETIQDYMCIKVQELLGEVAGLSGNVQDTCRCAIGCAIAGFSLFAIGDY